MMLEQQLGEPESSEDNFAFFLEQYEAEMDKNVERGRVAEEDLNYDNVVLFGSAAKVHIDNIYTFLEEEFGSYEVIFVEEPFEVALDTETDLYKFSFRGSVDLVIKTADGVYHMIDWKTSLKDWSDYKKGDTTTTDQLLFYRHFFSVLHGIPFDKIRSHFVVLSSTSHEIERIGAEYEVTDVERAMKGLTTMIHNVFERRFFPMGVGCGDNCECKTHYNLTTEE